MASEAEARTVRVTDFLFQRAVNHYLQNFREWDPKQPKKPAPSNQMVADYALLKFLRSLPTRPRPQVAGEGKGGVYVHEFVGPVEVYAARGADGKARWVDESGAEVDPASLLDTDEAREAAEHMRAMIGLKGREAQIEALKP